MQLQPTKVGSGSSSLQLIAPAFAAVQVQAQEVPTGMQEELSSGESWCVCEQMLWHDSS